MEVLVAADVADGIEITGGMHYRDLLAVDLDAPGRPLRDLCDRSHPDRRDHAPPPAAGQNPTKTICILHRGRLGDRSGGGGEAGESFVDSLVDLQTHLLEGDPVDYRLEEPMYQGVLGVLEGKPPALQVEELLGVHLPDGGAVGAAHVVGLDLELGDGV